MLQMLRGAIANLMGHSSHGLSRRLRIGRRIRPGRWISITRSECHSGTTIRSYKPALEATECGWPEAACTSGVYLLAWTRGSKSILSTGVLALHGRALSNLGFGF